MKNSIICLIATMLTISIKAQKINQEIIKEGRKPYLLGKIDKSGLTTKNYKTWFMKNYESYQVDDESVQELSSLLKDYNILVFMGTWCGDSKRRVPEFYKVLEACNFSMNQLKVVAVSYEDDLYKQSPNHEEKGLNIHRVPTFIFYKKGKEINRIVEEPMISFEKDILKIAKEKNYKSHYQIVTRIHHILSKNDLTTLQKRRKSLVKEFSNKVSSIYELNTYSKILLSTNKVKEAIEVLKLNTELFSNNPKTYARLVKVLLENKQDIEANKILIEASKKFPNDGNLKKLLREIKYHKS